MCLWGLASACQLHADWQGRDLGLDPGLDCEPGPALEPDPGPDLDDLWVAECDWPESGVCDPHCSSSGSTRLEHTCKHRRTRRETQTKVNAKMVTTMCVTIIQTLEL